MNVMPQREGLSRAEVEAFVGENAVFYLEKWGKHTGETLKGWNWCAMFFSIEWMVFRKMYVEAVLSFLAIVVLGTGLDMILYFGFHFYTDSSLLGNAFRILMGVLGNALYYKKAKRVVMASRTMNETEQLHTLQRKGGTSGGALAACIAIEIALSFLLIIM